jgi:hypothetical protein
MEGKTIVKTLELGEGVTLLKMDDGTFASVKVIDPEIPAETVEEFFEDDAKPVKKEVKEEKEEKKPSKKEPEPDPEDDKLEWDAIEEMSLKGLKKLIDEKNLLTDPEDFEDDLEGLKAEIAEELDIEIPKKGKKEEKKEETKDDSYTWADLVAMDFDELKELCEENKADTDPDDYDEDTEDAFRRAIAKEFEIEAPAKKKK